MFKRSKRHICEELNLAVVVGGEINIYQCPANGCYWSGLKGGGIKKIKHGSLAGDVIGDLLEGVIADFMINHAWE